jgi:hypothetical protein
MTATVNAITRAVGVERSSAFLDALRDARCAPRMRQEGTFTDIGNI